MGWITIDAVKLEAFIDGKGISKGDFSESIGRERTYIGKVLKRGTIQTHDYMFIKNLYNIDIIKEEEEPQEEIKTEEVTSVASLSPEEFSKVVYNAVYDAVLHAWENDPKEE